MYLIVWKSCQKWPRGHLVGPAISLCLRVIATRSLAHSLAERAKVAERPTSRGNEGDRGEERGRCVSAYVSTITTWYKGVA